MNDDRLVGRISLEFLTQTVGPVYDQSVIAAGRPETKMHARVMGSQISHGRLGKPMKTTVSRDDDDFGAAGVTAQPGINSPHLQPMSALGHIITEQSRALAAIRHQQIEISVVVDIGVRQGTRRPDRRYEISSKFTGINETSAPLVDQNEVLVCVVSPEGAGVCDRIVAQLERLFAVRRKVQMTGHHQPVGR